MMVIFIKNVYKKVFLGGGGSRKCVLDERAIERAFGKSVC